MRHFTALDILLIILAVGVGLFLLAFLLFVIATASRELSVPQALYRG